MTNLTTGLIHNKTNPVFNDPIGAGLFKMPEKLIEAIKPRNHQEAFIVGCSPTLHKLTDAQLNRIKAGFSVSTSSIAIFNDLMVDLMTVECVPFIETDTGKAVLDAISSRYNRSDRLLLVKDIHFEKASDCQDLINACEKADKLNRFITPDYFIPGHDTERLQANYTAFFKALGDNVPPFFIRRRASISMMLFILLCAGFKKVHFVACELESNDYYYGAENTAIHLTEDARFGLPVSDVIGAMIRGYNSVAKEPAELFSYRGRLVKKGIAKNFNL